MIVAHEDQFEALLSAMSMAPPGSKLKKILSDRAVGTLYNVLPHPPDTYLGPKFTYRQADGGMNNVHEPDLGRSGTPYAKTVQSKKCIHPSTLPDPGLVFDTLLKAKDVGINHFSVLKQCLLLHPAGGPPWRKFLPCVCVCIISYAQPLQE